jgi:hypothetical protein
MTNLANQDDVFFDTCVTLLQRMIETVPKGIELSDVVEPIPVKPINATLDFDTDENLIFTGYIRVSSIFYGVFSQIANSHQILTSETPAAPQLLALCNASHRLSGFSGFTRFTLLACSLIYRPLGPPRYNKNFRPLRKSYTLTTSLDKLGLVLSPESETGFSIFGSTTFFPFSTKISNAEAFTSFMVSGQGFSSKTFPVQSGAFVVPSLTSVVVINNTTATVSFFVATKQGSGGYVSRMMRRDGGKAPIVKIQAPVAQLGTLGPAIETFDNVAVTSVGQKAGYDVWEGIVTVDDWTLGPISVSVLDRNGVEVDVVMVD